MSVVPTFFATRQDAEASVPVRDGMSPTASVVSATLAAIFGADVASTLAPVNQPLSTVEPRQAMYAVIGGLRCAVYADPFDINVGTPGTNADGHLRAHARHGDAIVAGRNLEPDPTYRRVRYAIEDAPREAPEVLDAEVLADAAAGRATRQLLMSPAERRAIEVQAVRVVADHFEELGYRVADVGATESYDLDARRGDERVYVEVKGTTTSGDSVILTKNEVALHRSCFPHTALAIVRHITLDRSTEPPTAAGGELVLIHPWSPGDDDLTPLSYSYRVDIATDIAR